MVLLFHPGRLEGGIVISSREVRGGIVKTLLIKCITHMANLNFRRYRSERWFPFPINCPWLSVKPAFYH